MPNITMNNDDLVVFFKWNIDYLLWPHFYTFPQGWQYVTNKSAAAETITNIIVRSSGLSFIPQGDYQLNDDDDARVQHSYSALHSSYASIVSCCTAT